MEIKVVASTKENYQATKDEFDSIAGHGAGVCYLAGTAEQLFAEPPEKTARRVALIKDSGHHSPFDHSFITLELVDIPKIIAMALNNERDYTTNEKSARYTKMFLSDVAGDEQEYYNKWLDIFQKEIKEQCQKKSPLWFTDKRVLKLAQENARYLTSVFTPTTMLYTISYRQFNVLYSLFQKEIKRLENTKDPFFARFRDELQILTEKWSTLPYVEKALLKNNKNRSLSLFRKESVKKYFGDVYSLAYKGSFAQYAQAHRHRTLTNNITMLKKPEFYVPPILKKKPELVEEWKKDCLALSTNYPQGMLVMISERGNFEDYLLKVNERNCAQAQLEIDNQTTAITNEMYKAYKKQGDKEKVEILEPHLKGSRCTAGYKCESPCGFRDGITGERIV